MRRRAPYLRPRTTNEVELQQRRREGAVRQAHRAGRGGADFAVAMDTTTWTDTTAESGTTYVYRVQAKRPKTRGVPQSSNPQVVTIP